jgi:hypothetical protein
MGEIIPMPHISFQYRFEIELELTALGLRLLHCSIYELLADSELVGRIYTNGEYAIFDLLDRTLQISKAGLVELQTGETVLTYRLAFTKEYKHFAEAFWKDQSNFRMRRIESEGRSRSFSGYRYFWLYGGDQCVLTYSVKNCKRRINGLLSSYGHEGEITGIKDENYLQALVGIYFLINFEGLKPD